MTLSILNTKTKLLSLAQHSCSSAMESSYKDLNKLIKIINILFRFVGQDVEIRYLTDTSRGVNPFIVAIVSFCTGYSIYLLSCLSEMQDLVAISEIVWIVPLMVQYIVMSINNQVYHQSALELLEWIMGIFKNPHAVDLIQKHIEESNRKCMKLTKKMFG